MLTSIHGILCICYFMREREYSQVTLSKCTGIVQMYGNFCIVCDYFCSCESVMNCKIIKILVVKD